MFSRTGVLSGILISGISQKYTLKTRAYVENYGSGRQKHSKVTPHTTPHITRIFSTLPTPHPTSHNFFRHTLHHTPHHTNFFPFAPHHPLHHICKILWGTPHTTCDVGGMWCDVGYFAIFLLKWSHKCFEICQFLVM